MLVQIQPTTNKQQTIMENIKNAANSVSNRMDEVSHHVQGEAAKDRAMDPNRGVVERLEAGAHAVSEKTKETVSGMKADHYKEQAKHA
jgi:hypothetical protein